MKRFALWFALVVAVVTAGALAVARSMPALRVVEEFVSPGPLSSGHAYLADCRCTSCHEPGVGVTVANCTACHADSERLLGRQPTAFHASIQECAPCHTEHQRASEGGGVRPLVMDHVLLAEVGARTLARASRSDNESAVTLESLETWLGIRGPDDMDASAARESLDCAGCHDRRDPHFKSFGSDCAQCHGLESWFVAGYQHPSPRSQECSQCHQAPPSHFMGHFSMMSRKIANKESASVYQCFECHNTTGWNDIVDVGFYKHH